MTSRGSRLGVLLVLAMAVLALSAAGETWADHTSAPGGVGDRAVVLQSPWVDALAVGLGGADRREPGSERSAKQRLVLLAAASLLVLAGLSRRAIVAARPVPFPVAWWSLPSARAPPAFAG